MSQALKNWQSLILRAIQSQSQAPAILNNQPGFFLYQGSYRQSLLTVLKDIYPVIYQLVGNIFFEGLARSYISQYPLKTVDLNQYGGFFSDWLLKHTACGSLPYLAQVAQLEWAYHCAILMPVGMVHPPPPLMLSDAESLQLRFKLASNLQVFLFDYPIITIWQMHQSDHEIQGVDLSIGKESAIVLSTQKGATISKITILEGVFLKEIEAGKTLEEIAVKCEEHHIPMETMLPELLLRGWLQWPQLGSF